MRDWEAQRGSKGWKEEWCPNKSVRAGRGRSSPSPDASDSPARQEPSIRYTGWSWLWRRNGKFYQESLYGIHGSCIWFMLALSKLRSGQSFIQRRAPSILCCRAWSPKVGAPQVLPAESQRRWAAHFSSGEFHVIWLCQPMSSSPSFKELLEKSSWDLLKGEA